MRGGLEIRECCMCGPPSQFHQKCTIPDTNPGLIAHGEKYAKLLVTREDNMRINEALAHDNLEKKTKFELSRIDAGVLLNGTKHVRVLPNATNIIVSVSRLKLLGCELVIRNHGHAVKLTNSYTGALIYGALAAGVY